jgi:hypothetical protein
MSEAQVFEFVEAPRPRVSARDELAGRISHASLLCLSRCFGEMLSDVMLPP